MNRKILSSVPKIELHLHLDCSLSFDVVKKLRPNILEIEYEKIFVAPKRCTNLADFLKYAVSGLELMQTAEEIREVVKGLFVQLKRENIIYAEIRFAPFLHLQKGLLPDEVVEIVTDSVRECVDATGVKAGIILCTIRHYNEAESLQTIKLVEKYINNTHVVGFDIAGDEATFPIEPHKKAFQYGIKKDIPLTAHAGEARGAESVREVLQQFKPQRIGHGVRSVEDEALIEFLVKNKIHLEVCPTCNIQTNIYKEYSDHPIDILYKYGVSIGINTDGRSVVNVSLTDEYVKLADVFGWRFEHFYNCNINSLSHAFISTHEKNDLVKILNSGYDTYL